MKPIRCCICKHTTVHGVATAMMRSERFPSIFIHVACQQTVWHVLIMQMNLPTAIPLIQELTRDAEISQLLRTPRCESVK